MNPQPLVLPALRGRFGDWAYYACLFPIQELGARVDYAHDIHKEEALSKLIQRVLEGERAERIAEYLASNTERFFNSLVLATYGGDPHWLEIGQLKAASKDAIVETVPDNATDNLGFLYLSGAEKIFAVDGQHRLAGIKKALANNSGHDDLVPVLVIGHKKSAMGLRRTRRLFTTLNKTAVPVSKRDIIALDEDDVMAIIARRLLEDEPWFKPPKIAVIASHNVPTTLHGPLLTIANLYDVLKQLFVHEVMTENPGMKKGKALSKLRFNRPNDEVLDNYRNVAKRFFTAIARAFPPVGELFKAANPGAVTAKYRRVDGGHLLFRPIGIEIVTRLAIEYAVQKNVALSTAVKKLSGLPTSLADQPFVDVLWNPAQRVMVLKGKQLALDLGRHMLSLKVSKAGLLDRYRAITESDRKLPSPLD